MHVFKKLAIEQLHKLYFNFYSFENYEIYASNIFEW